MTTDEILKIAMQTYPFSSKYKENGASSHHIRTRCDKQETGHGKKYEGLAYFYNDNGRRNDKNPTFVHDSGIITDGNGGVVWRNGKWSLIYDDYTGECKEPYINFYTTSLNTLIKEILCQIT